MCGQYSNPNTSQYAYFLLKEHAMLIVFGSKHAFTVQLVSPHAVLASVMYIVET